EGLWTFAIDTVLSDMGYESLNADYLSGFYLTKRWEFLVQELNINAKITVREMVDATKRVFINHIEKYRADMDLKDGFWSLLAELQTDRGLKIGLATNTDRDVVS